MKNIEKPKLEKKESAEKPITAVCVVIENMEGKILLFKSLYQRTSGKTEAVGLPAGLVDTTDSGKSEDPEIAATRELLEETGLQTNGPLVLLYDGETPSGKRVVSYLCPKWQGEIKASEEGLVYWGEKEELTGESGGYPDYNKKVLQALQSINSKNETYS